MVKHTQTIRWQIPDELFECVWPFCEIGAKRVNARLSVWWTRDKTTIKGIQLESLTSTHGFHQLISQPTHLLPQTFSCIDLIITDQPIEILMNIFSNFTPNKLVTFDDRDPPWMIDFVKSKIEWKNQLYKIYIKNVYKCTLMKKLIKF